MRRYTRTKPTSRDLSARSACLALACIGSLAAGGCGGSPSPQGPTQPDEVVLPSGPRVLALPRPMDDLVEVALWIDAGARDASPPGVALVTAAVAARAAGPGVRARVFPDGTELRARCQLDTLERCIASLARALGLRSVTPEAHARAMQHLTRSREIATADPDQQAQQLALEALFGSGAAGLLPLGVSEAGTLERAAVESFLHAHYGPDRTLLIAAGALGSARLAEVARDAFGALPAAHRKRQPRRLEPETGGLQLRADAADRVAIALPARDLREAAGLARALATARGLGAYNVAAAACADQHVRAEAVPVRGGALALAQIGCSDAEAAVAGLSYEAVRARLEPEPGDAAALTNDDGVAPTLERLGLRWVAGSGGTETYGDAMGLGVTVGPADGALDTRHLRARLERARARAMQIAEGRTRGDVDGQAASVVLPNKARIEVRRRTAAARMAVAIGFAGGSGQEPPLLHGRAALLASLGATGCAQLPRDALEAELRALNATLEPRVTPGYWGLVVRAPRAHWQRAVDLVVSCALEPTWAEGALLDARIGLRQRLGEPGQEHWLRAQIARSLAPGAPGLVAPWGAAGTVANLTGRDLRRAWRAARRGARLSVALVGDVPVEAAVARLARRVGGLTAGRLPSRPLAGEVVPGPLAARAVSSRPVAIVGLRTRRAPRGAGSGARAFAAVLAKQLAASGLDLRWHGGGADRGGAWAAVAVEADLAALRELPARVQASTAQIGAAMLEPVVGAHVQRANQARRLAMAEPGWEAEQLIAARLGEPEAAWDDAAASLEVALALRTGSVGFVIAGAGRSPALRR